MAQPKWQRARILPHPTHPQFESLMVWVEMGAPKMAAGGRDTVTRLPNLHEIKAYRTNCRDNGRVVQVAAVYVELLSRDENDFAVNVPIVTWDEYKTTEGIN